MNSTYLIRPGAAVGRRHNVKREERREIRERKIEKIRKKK
jgi:hypothetical protein